VSEAKDANFLKFSVVMIELHDFTFLTFLAASHTPDFSADFLAISSI
jgi:hypothetical protein